MAERSFSAKRELQMKYIHTYVRTTKEVYLSCGPSFWGVESPTSNVTNRQAFGSFAFIVISAR